MSLALAPDMSVEVGVDLPCRRFDPDLWFAESPAELELAKSLGGDCPVRVECLAGAVERQGPGGAWGGELFGAGPGVPRKGPGGGPPREDGAPARAPAVEERSGGRA